MVKKFFSLFLIVFMISSCGNTGKNEAVLKAENTGDAINVKFSSLAENPRDFVGKNIVVEGKVVHVCMQSGKKLFIVGENPDIRLYIQAGENMPKFPMDLLGSKVSVEGTIVQNGAATMVSPGTKHKGMEMGVATAPGSAKSDSCETENALAGQSSLADIVMEYTSHIVK